MPKLNTSFVCLQMTFLCKQQLHVLCTACVLTHLCDGRESMPANINIWKYRYGAIEVAEKASCINSYFFETLYRMNILLYQSINRLCIIPLQQNVIDKLSYFIYTFFFLNHLFLDRQGIIAF